MLTQDRPTQANTDSLLGTDRLLLKRPILIKAIVTPLWKEEAEQQIQAQAEQLDGQLEQLDTQVQQMLQNLSQQSQIQDIQNQANDLKKELLEQKAQVLEQLKQFQGLELGQEVEQGQVDNFFYAKRGDHLIRGIQVEVVLRDGVIEEIRGDL